MHARQQATRDRTVPRPDLILFINFKSHCFFVPCLLIVLSRAKCNFAAISHFESNLQRQNASPSDHKDCHVGFECQSVKQLSNKEKISQLKS